MSPNFMEDLQYFLSKVPLFSSIPQSQIKEVAELFHPGSMEKGTVICRQGEPGETMYIIRSGLVGVYAEKEDESLFLTELGRGQFFGEMAILSETPRNATVKVSLDATFYSLSRDDFQKLLLRNKSIGLYLSRYYARRMTTVKDQTREKIRKPVFYAVSATDPELGLAHFLYTLSYHIATESKKKVLIVEPHHERRTILQDTGLLPIACPDVGLFRLLPPNLYRPEDFHWLRHESGFAVLQVRKGFSKFLSQSLPHLMEGFRDSFDLIFFSLSHGMNDLERQMVRLCDRNLVLINNTESALPKVRKKLAEIEKTAGPGLDRVRVGVSHLCGEKKGLPRQELRERLNLSEIPGIWVDRSEAAFKERIDKEKVFPVKGARAVAREIAGVRVGLALGAGAARGWAHIGVLKVLEEEGIHIDMIAGTSMGALVGAIYAARASVDILKQYTIDLFPTRTSARRKIFDYTVPFHGLLQGRKALGLVATAVNNADFMDLKIPAYIIGVDILKGEEVLIHAGDVSSAVRASLSIPAIFKPYLHNNRWMVDGGLLNPVPVNILEQKGADRIIAVCVEHPDKAGNNVKKAPFITQVISRTISIVHGRAVGDFAEKADIVLYPDVQGFAWDDFHKGQILMQRGLAACRENIEEIKRLAG
ncbi:MAG: cyclic nucleotide-binding domain-containing protein [Desulfobacteraceae bacterium]